MRRPPNWCVQSAHRPSASGFPAGHVRARHNQSGALPEVPNPACIQASSSSSVFNVLNPVNGVMRAAVQEPCFGSGRGDSHIMPGCIPLPVDESKRVRDELNAPHHSSQRLIDSSLCAWPAHQRPPRKAHGASLASRGISTQCTSRVSLQLQL